MEAQSHRVHTPASWRAWSDVASGCLNGSAVALWLFAIGNSLLGPWRSDTSEFGIHTWAFIIAVAIGVLFLPVHQPFRKWVGHWAGWTSAGLLLLSLGLLGMQLWLSDEPVGLSASYLLSFATAAVFLALLLPRGPLRQRRLRRKIGAIVGAACVIGFFWPRISLLGERLAAFVNSPLFGAGAEVSFGLIIVAMLLLVLAAVAALDQLIEWKISMDERRAS